MQMCLPRIRIKHWKSAIAALSAFCAVAFDMELKCAQNKEPKQQHKIHHPRRESKHTVNKI